MYCKVCATLHQAVTLPFQCTECGHILQDENLQYVRWVELLGIKARYELRKEEDIRCLNLIQGIVTTLGG